MKLGFSGAQCLAGFGPDFGFDATAAHGARGFTILEENHFGPTALRRRSACAGYRSHNDAFASSVGIADELVEIPLSDSSHNFTDTELALASRPASLLPTEFVSLRFPDQPGRRRPDACASARLQRQRRQ